MAAFSPNDTVRDFVPSKRLSSIIALLFWWFDFSTLLSFLLVLLLQAAILSALYCSFDGVADVFTFFRLFLRRKLPEPFSLLRRDETRR